ncbi:cardiolipin synthase [Salinisphaera hydrothermalis]|uniref:Cardiolipin synthase n=1 Tax=Salinisphaera hydrothermalis (strain C41B8) TaxID=1304275 RepID=A0A084IJ71_SALHC|nr:cardiolipin synthase [Salinisphaera hydrothermalis]KEZ76755.1 phospholipase D/transphosphatidylase [Salinisphaera hydrothermalis C41B8]
MNKRWLPSPRGRIRKNGPAVRHASAWNSTIKGCGLGTALLLCWVMTGCASLPRAVHTDKPVPAAKPIVFGAHGPLSRAQSEHVIQHLQQGADDSGLLRRHLAVEAALTNNPLVTGNKATLLINGPSAFAAIFNAIAHARHTVNIETYILNDDTIGKRLAKLLLKKRAEGVKVNLMYDGYGSMDTPAAYFDRLQAAGVQVVEYHPIDPLKGGSLANLNNRDHRKLIIVDGRIAFTGGINITSVYSASPERRLQEHDDRWKWRDTDIEIQGPVVADFQKIFISHWQSQNGPTINPPDYFPPLHDVGSQVVRALASRHDEPQPKIYATLLSAINSAQQSIHITAAYFVPNDAFIKALTAAARRGVHVVLILPAHTDKGFVRVAGRSYYSTLLKAGVKIYERQDAILHAKTIVIDGVWSTVGSTNLDWRSFRHNDEVNAVVLGQAFGHQMEAQFQKDRAKSKRITRWAWERRSLWERFEESFTRLGAWWF